MEISSAVIATKGSDKLEPLLLFPRLQLLLRLNAKGWDKLELGRCPLLELTQKEIERRFEPNMGLLCWRMWTGWSPSSRLGKLAVWCACLRRLCINWLLHAPVVVSSLNQVLRDTLGGAADLQINQSITALVRSFCYFNFLNNINLMCVEYICFA